MYAVDLESGTTHWMKQVKCLNDIFPQITDVNGEWQCTHAVTQYTILMANAKACMTGKYYLNAVYLNV